MDDLYKLFLTVYSNRRLFINNRQISSHSMYSIKRFATFGDIYSSFDRLRYASTTKVSDRNGKVFSWRKVKRRSYFNATQLR